LPARRRGAGGLPAAARAGAATRHGSRLPHLRAPLRSADPALVGSGGRTRRLLGRVHLDQARHPVDAGVLPATGERRMADLLGPERTAHQPGGVPDDLPQLFAAVLHLRLLLPRTGLPLVPALVLDPDGADE